MAVTTYVDFTKNISYKRERKLYKDPYTDKTKKALENFIEILSVSQDLVKSALDNTDDAKMFYKMFPVFEEIDCKDEEAFYEFKLGYKIDGVPSRLVYILSCAIKKYGTEFPNMTLQSVYRSLVIYDDYYFVNNGEEILLSDVIYFMFKYKFDLLTARRLRTGVETYIPNADRVALIPDDMIQETSKEISWDIDKGLVAAKGGSVVILRTVGNRLGVTTDDFDLRKAY
jgi:hypothetical protein